MTYDEFDRLFRAAHAPHPVDGPAQAALGRIAAAFAAGDAAYARRLAICAEIGRAVDDTLRDSLTAARDRFEEDAVAAMLARLEATFAASPQAGWEAWQHELGLSIVEGFRHRFARPLCAHPFPIPEAHRPAHAQLCRAAACMEQARWEEVIDEIAQLARRPFLPDRLRARLLTIEAQIELWRFNEHPRARALLDEALALCPEDAFVLATQGDVALESGGKSEAQALYERAIAAGPTECNGYVGLGELHQKAGEFDAAREWFERGVREAPGEATSHERLMKLLGRKGELEDHREDIERLRVRRDAIDPEGEYDSLLGLGDLFRDDGRLDEAQAWYDRARRLQPRWPRADVAAGEACRTAGNPAGAERHARRAIELDASLPAAHLLLAQVLEEQFRWDEALRAFEAFPERPARWKLYARASAGRMLARLGRLPEARERLREVLAVEVDSPLTQVYATGELEALARASSEERSDEETALSIYDELLEAKGGDYRARYHNLVGNVHYYRSRWERAIEHYRLALAARPGEAVYHRYIAGALRSMQRWSQAAEEIDAAFAIDHDAARRDEELAALANARGDAAGAAGRHAEAIEQHAEACRLAPRLPEYLVDLAESHERVEAPGQRLGHLHEAAALFRRAHDLGGDARLLDRANALQRRAQLAATHGEQVLDRINTVTPIVVEVASDLVRFVEGGAPGGLHPVLADEIAAMRAAITADYGIVMPGIRLRGNEGTLAPSTAIVMIDEVPLISCSVPAARRFVAGTPAAIATQGLRVEPGQDPVDGTPGVWVDAGDLARLGEAGTAAWTPQHALIRQVEAVVRRNLVDFVGFQEVAALLREVPAALQSAMREEPALMGTLVNVCRGLLAEGVTLAPFPELCSTVLAMQADGARPRDVVERIRLLPGFRDRLPGRTADSVLLRTGERFDAAVRQALYRRGGQAVLALEPAACQQLLEALPETLRERGRALVVGEPTLRPFVRRLVELSFPDLPVLSAAETRDGARFDPQRVEPATPLAPAATPFGASPAFAMPAGERDTAADEANTAAPVVELAVPAGFAAWRSPADGALAEAVRLLPDTLFHELGVLLPEVVLREQASLPAAQAELRIGDAPPQRIELAEFGAQLGAALRAGAERFVTPACTQYMLDGLQPSFPDLVERALERFPIARLTAILRHLLTDQVSVRDLPGLLNALVCIEGTTDVDLDRFIAFPAHAEPLCPDPLARAPADLPAALLADHLRTTQRRALSHRHSAGGASMDVLLLDRGLELRLRETALRPLTAEERERLVAAVRAELPASAAPATGPALLTNFDLRTPLRRALRDAFPLLPVLCYQDLVPELSLHPVARVAWSGQAGDNGAHADHRRPPARP